LTPATTELEQNINKYSDEEGRDILAGITVGNGATFLPALNTNELAIFKSRNR